MGAEVGLRQGSQLDLAGEGAGGGLLGGRRCVGEELEEVGDLGIAGGLQFRLDAFEKLGDARAGGLVEGLDGGAVLGDDVVGGFLAVAELVEAGAVVEEGAAHETDLFKGGEAAINGDEIAGAVAQLAVDLLDADGLAASDKHTEDGNARLGDAKAGSAQTGASGFDARLGVEFLAATVKRVVSLSGGDHGLGFWQGLYLRCCHPIETQSARPRVR